MNNHQKSGIFNKSITLTHLFILLALLLIPVVTVSPASAQTSILSQSRVAPGDPYPCNIWYTWCDPSTWPSDSVYAGPFDDADGSNGAINVLAENFVMPTAGAITEIKLWGGYWYLDQAPANDNFNVIFHDDAGGTIGSVASDPAFTTSRDDAGATWVNMKWCATCNGNALVFEYTLTMTDTVNLSAGNYWVEIYNDTTGHTAKNDFFWTWGYLDPTNGIDGLAWAQGSAPGSSWNIDSDGNLALEISGTMVPEPVSSSLFIIGGAILGFRKFRGKNKIA